MPYHNFIAWAQRCALLLGWVWGLGAICAASPNSSRTALEALLRDPTAEEWAALSRFDFAVSREDFVARLDAVFDPARGLRPYLRLNALKAEVYATPRCEGRPVAVIRFRQAPTASPSSPFLFRRAAAPAAFPRRDAGLPLAGLRVAIDPADIGGAWAKMEDRSVEFRGFGRINDGISISSSEKFSATNWPETGRACFWCATGRSRCWRSAAGRGSRPP